MRIIFANNEIQTEANNLKKLVEKYGQRKSRMIRQRLDEIAAASNLHDLNKLPAIRCDYLDSQESIMTLYTIPPSILVFSIAKNLEDLNKIQNYRWDDITLIEIMSLDGGVQ